MDGNCTVFAYILSNIPILGEYAAHLVASNSQKFVECDIDAVDNENKDLKKRLWILVLEKLLSQDTL